MARYNAWQNNAVNLDPGTMTADELLKDRGAFFGSIMAHDQPPRVGGYAVDAPL